MYACMCAILVPAQYNSDDEDSITFFADNGIIIIYLVHVEKWGGGCMHIYMCAIDVAAECSLDNNRNSFHGQ